MTKSEFKNGDFSMKIESKMNQEWTSRTMVETMLWQEKRELQMEDSEWNQAMIGRHQKWKLMSLTLWVWNCEFEALDKMKNNANLIYRYWWKQQTETKKVNRDWRTRKSRIFSRDDKKIYSWFCKKWTTLKRSKQLNQQQHLRVFCKESDSRTLMITWNYFETIFSKEKKQPTDV
jgi:hypothetical protein